MTGLQRKTPMNRGTSQLQAKTPLGRGDKSLGRGAGPARVTRLQPVSAKRRQENRERRAMANARWPDGERPRCARPGCPRLADDLHEILSRARGGSITDETNTVPLCRQCNHDATRDPEDMITAGLVRHSWEGPPRGRAA